MKLTVNASWKLICAEEELKGTVRTAVSVADDLRAVFGDIGGVHKSHSLSEIQGDGIIFGTIQESDLLASLEKEGRLFFDEIRDKREVYQMCVLFPSVENDGTILVIAGSDKRGTIYGLYRFSEMCGIPPLRKWSGCEPKKQSGITLELPAEMTSHEPSVRYRGIFDILIKSFSDRVSSSSYSLCLISRTASCVYKKVRLSTASKYRTSDALMKQYASSFLA